MQKKLLYAKAGEFRDNAISEFDTVCTELTATMTEEPLASLKEEICRVPLSKERAKELFGKCAHPLVATFHARFQLAKTKSEIMSEIVQHALCGDAETRAEKERALEATRKTSYNPALEHAEMLAMMIALWQKLPPTTPRANAVKRTESQINNDSLPSPLIQLARQAKEGRPAFIV